MVSLLEVKFNCLFYALFRSSSEPKSDHEDDILPSLVSNRLDPVRSNNGLVSKSSSGYFEHEKVTDDRVIVVSKPDFYRRQFSDECHSDRSPKSTKSFGRPHSSLEIESQADFIGNRFSHHDIIGAGFTERARSVASDGASGKLRRISVFVKMGYHWCRDEASVGYLLVLLFQNRPFTGGSESTKGSFVARGPCHTQVCIRNSERQLCKRTRDNVVLQMTSNTLNCHQMLFLQGCKNME